MTVALDPNHPKQTFRFFVSQGLNDTVRAGMKELVRGLAQARTWLNGPPRFVDHREGASASSSSGVPADTIGACLSLYSALPPWMLPREIDLQHFEEVETLLNAIVDFSRQHAVKVEFNLDDESVGTIQGGAMDRDLAQGLMGEWLRHLAATTPDP